jgi:Abortive infection alpha
MSNELIPISDEQAKLGHKALEVLQGFGGFLREMLGTVPEDVVGLLGGDWLKVRRAVNMASILGKAREKLERRGVEHREEVSLSLALPLLHAAADESRPELQDLWASLLAAAMDPARANAVRLEFIEAAKVLHPRDAVIMQTLHQNPGQLSPNTRDYLANALKITSDAVEVALRNLEKASCVSSQDVPRNSGNWFLTAFGRELMRACSG